MRKRNYFLLALASMAFAACSNDDFVADVDNGIITEPTGDAWVALNVRPPSLASTRGLHIPDHENGTPAETEIKSVRAIFFTSGASPTVTADIELTLSQAGANASGQPTGNAGEAFKVPAASKRVLIVANASKEFKDRAPSGWSGGTPYATVNDALVLSTGNGVLSFTDGFMMSNAKGGLEPFKTEEPGLGDPVDLTLYKNATGAVANPLVINIDRVVAKVRVYITKASDVASIENEGWLLNATNTKFYPTSERISTWFELNPAGGFRAPFDQYKKGSYRKDPNYDAPHSGVDYTYITTDPGTWNVSNTSEYCLENTQDKAGNVHAYTTHVLLRAKFIPKKYKKADMTDTDVQDATGDWMLIDGGYYTFATLTEWIEAELKYKYSKAVPTSITTPLTTAYNKYLGADGVNVGEVTLPDAADDTEIGDLVNKFTGKRASVIGVEDRGKTVGSLTYYKNAFNYYKIMIKHDDTDLAVNELGEFGVVRNSVYDINVNKFNNPGYPDVPKPDPGEEDEDEDGWLSIKINVNPWTWYTQTEEL